MHRYLLTAVLLLLAATAQGMSPARQDANGGSGSCPESQADAAAEAAGPVVSAPSAPTAAPSSAAQPGKGEALVRPRNSTRWHSFLPGMFK